MRHLLHAACRMPRAQQWRAPTMGSAAQRSAHVGGCTGPWRHVKRGCTLHGVRCMVQGVRCMVHVAQCALHAACCTVCVLCCMLRAARCTAVRFMLRCTAHRAFSSASVTVHLFHAGRSLRSDLGTDATDRSDPAVAERKTTQPKSRTAQKSKHANKHARRENKTNPRARRANRRRSAAPRRCRPARANMRRALPLQRACKSPPPRRRPAACARICALAHGRRASGRRVL